MLSPYKTVHGAGSDSFTEKRSKFIGYAKPVKTAEEVSKLLESGAAGVATSTSTLWFDPLNQNRRTLGGENE